MLLLFFSSWCVGVYGLVANVLEGVKSFLEVAFVIADRLRPFNVDLDDEARDDEHR